MSHLEPETKFFGEKRNLKDDMENCIKWEYILKMLEPERFCSGTKVGNAYPHYFVSTALELICDRCISNFFLVLCSIEYKNFRRSVIYNNNFTT